MATRTIANGGGNFSSTSTWVEGAVPTASDDVVASGTSGQLTVDVSSASQSANFANYTGTLTWNAQWTIGRNAAGTKVFTLVAGMTVVNGASGNLSLSGGASSGAITVTTAGKTLPGVSTGAASQTTTFADNVTCAGSIICDRATFDFTGRTVQCSIFSYGAALTRTVNLTNANLTCTLASGNAFTATGNTGLTMTTTGSTITLSGAGATFRGQAKTYATVAFTGGGTCSVLEANTFTTLSWTGTLKLPASTTTTVTNLSGDGTAPTHNVLQSGTAGTAATLSKVSGTLTMTNVLIVDIAASGGAAFVAQNGCVRGVSSGWTAKRAMQPAATGAGR